MDPADRMRALLLYASSARVARGLTEKGYSVSGPTVSRWAKGRYVTPHKLQLVADLLGATEADVPEWAQQMDAKLDTLLAASGVNLGEVLEEVLLRATDETSAPPAAPVMPALRARRLSGGPE